MQNNWLETFIDRREAIALFELLRKSDPNRPWPLLPILTFVGPGGSGKSTLIKYLRARHCCLPDGRAILPYAYLDFTQVDAPRDLLSILVALRDQLQAHGDGQGRNLNFPYFDLGAAIALATPSEGMLPTLKAGAIQRKLIGAWTYFESLSEIGYSLGNIVPIIPPLLAGLKLHAQIPVLQELLDRLEYSSGWHWYRLHGKEIGLSAEAGVGDVLLRLHALSQPGKAGKQGREYLVQHLLSAALLADLREALDSFNGPSAWSETTNVVLFLDGFDTLPGGPSTGLRLLEMLALGEHRKRGEADPLLLVIGSQQRLLELSDTDQQGAFEEDVAMQLDNDALHVRSRMFYERWQQQLPSDKRLLGLRELYLPLRLHDFELDDTADYLLELGEREQTPAFTETGLVQSMHSFTHGHPLYLALAAASVLEAGTHARSLETADFDLDMLFPEVVADYRDVALAEYLCSLYLRQLSRQEEEELIFGAVPRVLDIETLQIVLQLPNDNETGQQWERLRRNLFMRAIDDERIVFHPIVRDLLLQRLPSDRSAKSNYHRIHTRLREHFHMRASMLTSSQIKDGDYARIEEVYHALALGDPEPAIGLALFAQRSHLVIWESLLEAITQAPTGLMPAHTTQQATDALALAMQHHRIQDTVVALVLYTWLLAKTKRDSHEAAELHNNLGAAYWTLTSGDRQANLEQAIACYQAALQVYTRDAFPVDWATTQNNLGAAYWTLTSGDRRANLEQAIASCEAALQVYTHEAFPSDWARTQYNLGRAYNDLPGEYQQANLEQAIACYQAALQVYTRDDFPAIWAKTYDSLGNAYLNLPGAEQEDRQENLRRAIACFKSALGVYTRDAFPFAWASVQHRLGDAYRDLTEEDAQQVNLQQAIAFYQSALQVYTREVSPTEWAEAQDSLGYTYASVSGINQQERRAHLERAIACYENALQVYTRDAFPSNWASTQNNLGYAYAFLPAGEDAQERRAHLERAIACYEGALQVFHPLQMDNYIQLVSDNLADAQEVLQQVEPA